MPEYQIDVAADPQPADIQVVLDGLRAYNAAQLGYDDARMLAIYLRDGAGAIVGGAVGWTYWGWLAVDNLWIRDDLRGGGHGRRLLLTAETAARARGCRHVLLDTMDFQAPGFYEKLGYQVFGVLEGMPAGHQRIYFRKDLE